MGSGKDKKNHHTNNRKDKCHNDHKDKCHNDHKDKNVEKIENLKVKNFCGFNVKIKKLQTDALTVENATVTNTLTTENIIVNDLQATYINGKLVDCEQNFLNVNSPLVTTDPLVYPENSGYNKIVWEGLAAATLDQQDQLAQRLQCGRLQEKFIQDKFGCVVCPPNELVACFPTCDPPSEDICECPEEVGVCPSVPLHIFGIKTVEPISIRLCGSSLEQQITQLISTISYNLDVTNVTGNLATRVVTVLVQVGYLDENDVFAYEEIDFGNRQFGPTLDTGFGEKYTGTVVLDTELMSFIAVFPNKGALVQLVVFSEDGVEIDMRSRSRKARQTAPSADGAVDTQFVGQSVGGQLQWANIYSNYTLTQTNIISLESSMVLEQLVPSTQWVMGWLFNGPTPPGGAAGGYFGINTDGDGKPQFLASIFNAALSAQVGQPWVTAVNFGGEGEGWSLRITPENISNFPININQTYVYKVNRQATSPTETTWEFIITNTTTSATVNLGTIKTSNLYTEINPNGSYQFSEYFGPGAPQVTCDTIPLSVATWTFIVANGVAGSSTYNAWSPPPQHCGPFKITPDTSLSNVVMRFGQGA